MEIYIYTHTHSYIHIKPIENISTKATQNAPPPCRKHGPWWTRRGVGGCCYYQCSYYQLVLLFWARFTFFQWYSLTWLLLLAVGCLRQRQSLQMARPGCGALPLAPPTPRKVQQTASEQDRESPYSSGAKPKQPPKMRVTVGPGVSSTSDLGRGLDFLRAQGTVLLNPTHSVGPPPCPSGRTANPRRLRRPTYLLKARILAGCHTGIRKVTWWFSKNVMCLVAHCERPVAMVATSIGSPQ